MKLRLLLGAFLDRVVGKRGINVKFRDDEAPVMARLRIVQLSSKGRMVVPTAAVRYYRSFHSDDSNNIATTTRRKKNNEGELLNQIKKSY